MTTVDRLINGLESYLMAMAEPNFAFPNTVEDPVLKSNSMIMSDYSEIESIRVDYGHGELYDILVARVK